MNGQSNGDIIYRSREPGDSTGPIGMFVGPPTPPTPWQRVRYAWGEFVDEAKEALADWKAALRQRWRDWRCRRVGHIKRYYRSPTGFTMDGEIGSFQMPHITEFQYEAATDCLRCRRVLWRESDTKEK